MPPPPNDTPSSYSRAERAAAALTAYRGEKSRLDVEANRLSVLRKRIESAPHIRVEFGHWYAGSDGRASFSEARSYQYKDIIFGNGSPAPIDGVEPNNRRADEIAGPGLRACLLMWLAEQERTLRLAQEAWDARDPIAEMVEASNA